MAPLEIHTLDTTDDALVGLVATRMRRTLEEVLGSERGGSMYTHAWLVDRVRWHFDPACCVGTGFVGRLDGEVVGHTLLRIEQEGEVRFGLFSTIWVAPTARRRGVASQLIGAGEGWMRSRGLVTTATFTAVDNERLHIVFGRCGYALTETLGEMVRLERAL